MRAKFIHDDRMVAVQVDGKLTLGATMRPDGKEWVEIYRRVAACINACDGIPTEALECQTKRGLTEKLLREREAMKAALNRIASWSEGREVTGHFDEPCAAETAREALKKIEAIW